MLAPHPDQRIKVAESSTTLSFYQYSLSTRLSLYDCTTGFSVANYAIGIVDA